MICGTVYFIQPNQHKKKRQKFGHFINKIMALNYVACEDRCKQASKNRFNVVAAAAAVSAHDVRPIDIIITKNILFLAF